jgi:hypothetical protein
VKMRLDRRLPTNIKEGLSGHGLITDRNRRMVHRLLEHPIFAVAKSHDIREADAYCVGSLSLTGKQRQNGASLMSGNSPRLSQMI